jgi:ATP-binding protein involved in chromosome partitioning
MPSPEIIAARLASVASADGKTPLTSSGALSQIVVTPAGHVVFSIAIDGADVASWTPVRAAAVAAVRGLPGVTGATVTLTAERPSATANSPAPMSAKVQPAKLAGLADVRHVIAVASGKGGVGKSTTACNLALGLRGLGLKVGVLDADIYGPSMPKLFALKGQPEIVTGRTLRPLEAYGCKVMSIGFVVDPGKAMVWRGPMVASAITQMLRDVAWGPLDVLVVDMPPGTGDAQLTMAQATPLAGAVIVSTPQDLALIDARRGVSMFEDVGVPILGIVENMSYFVCDGCGKRHDIFAHGGARAEAAKLGVPFLGEVPLDIEIRERSDAGLPIVVTAPDGPHAATYRAIARTVWTALSKR